MIRNSIEVTKHNKCYISSFSFSKIYWIICKKNKDLKYDVTSEATKVIKFWQNALSRVWRIEFCENCKINFSENFYPQKLLPLRLRFWNIENGIDSRNEAEIAILSLERVSLIFVFSQKIDLRRRNLLKCDHKFLTELQIVEIYCNVFNNSAYGVLTQ